MQACGFLLFVSFLGLFPALFFLFVLSNFNILAFVKFYCAILFHYYLLEAFFSNGREKGREYGWEVMWEGTGRH